MIAYRRFTGLLESKGIVTHEHAGRLLEKFHGDQWAVMHYLSRRTAVATSKLGRLWGEALGVAYVELRKQLFQSHIVRKIPADFAKKHLVIPLYQLGGVVTVATADPTNFNALFEAEKYLGCPVSPVFSTPEEIEYAVDIQYQSTGIFAGGEWFRMDDVLEGEELIPTPLRAIKGGKPVSAKREPESKPVTVTQDDIKRMLAERQKGL